MEWNCLKSAEAGWELSSSKMSLLEERVYQMATAPRKFYIPMLKPILAVAGMAVLLFGLLLLWPKKPMEEQIVTVPGASSEAKPGGYIEKNEPSEEGSQTPPKDEEKGTPPGEEKHPAIVGGEDQEEEKEEELPVSSAIKMEDAIKVAKERATSKNFDRKLSESERKALSQYLAFENYYYLKAQEEGEIGRLKESGAKEYILEVKVFSTKEYLGKNLFGNLPVGTLSEKTSTKAPGDLENPYFYPRILGAEIKSSADYLGALSMSNVLPDGAAEAAVMLGKKPLTKEQIQALVDHFLDMKEITWVELSYRVNDDDENPTAIHRFWETQKELPFEKARAIVVEKIQKRFDQKLSERERMAFYVVMSNLNHQLWNYQHIHDYSLILYSTQKGIGLCPAEDFSLNLMTLEGATLSLTPPEEGKKIKAMSKAVYDIDIPKKQGEEGELYFNETETFSAQSMTVGKYGVSGANMKFVVDSSKNVNPTMKQMDECIRHLLSIECVVWCGFDGMSVPYD